MTSRVQVWVHAGVSMITLDRLAKLISVKVGNLGQHSL